jgi:hypothetical protein
LPFRIIPHQWTATVPWSDARMIAAGVHGTGMNETSAPPKIVPFIKVSAMHMLAVCTQHWIIDEYWHA